MTRLILLGLGATALVAMAPFLAIRQAPAQKGDKTPWVLVANPEARPISRTLVLPGEVRANQEVVLYSRAKGYLEEIRVDRGDWASKGDVLAKIAVPEIEKKLAREKAELALSAPGLARDRATLTWRENIWKRLNETLANSPLLVNRDSLDDARGRYEAAEAELKVTAAREAALRAAVEKTKVMIDFATIRAPFDGYITERWTDPGDLIQPTSTMIARLTQVDPVRVRIRVPESDVLSIRPDSKVKVTIQEMDGKEIDASIARIFWALHPRTKAMRVEIDLENADGAIRPGMSATASVELEHRKDALVLPATSLITEPESVEIREKANERMLPGEVLPFQQVGVYARVQGFLESIAVDRGDIVRKGQVLAKIAVPELEKERVRQEAELALCPPSIARDQAILRWRETGRNRLQGIAEKTPNLVTRDELDDAVGRHETAKAELELTQAREASLRAAVEETQAMIDLATIRAPFDGYITGRWADPGALVHPGKTKILHLMQADPLRVRIHIPQDEVSHIRNESPARIEFPFAEVPGEPFTHPIKRLFWALNRNTKTMSTEIDMPNPDRTLRPGMYAEVTIPFGKPAEAGEEKTRHEERTAYYVLVVVEKVVNGEKRYTVQKTKIEIGHDDGVDFEVIKGVGAGTDVIIRGKNLVSQYKVKEGEEPEKVRVARRK